MAEHLVKPGVYVPETGLAYPEKPDEFILASKKLHEVDVEHGYEFLDKSLKAKFLNVLFYAAIFTLVAVLQKVRYGLKVEGRENLREARPHLKNGAITVCNHVYRWDFLAVVNAVGFRRLWFPARAQHLEGGDAVLIRGVGGIPIPTSISAMRQFNAAFDELHQKGKWLHVFPETSRWEFYEPIRPFNLGAFKMAVRYQVPLIPLVLSYRKPGGLRKLLGVKHPLLTIHIGKAMLPGAFGGLTKNEAAKKMRLEAHSQMVEMAGIVKNKWGAELERYS